MSDFSLESDELTFYREHGYLVRRDVFSTEEVERLRRSVETAVRKAFDQTRDGQTYILDGKRFVDIGHMTVQFEHSPGSETIRVIEPVQHLHPELDDLVADKRIVSPVRSILGGHISIWTNKLNLKRGREGSGFGWHQDSPYWIHNCDHVDRLPNVYLAFDDATEANGCLKVIDRSHHRGCLPGTADGSQLGGLFTEPNCFSEEDAVSLALTAGSIALFDAHTIHGSSPNHTDEARRAIVMTYQPANFPMLKTGVIRNINL